MTRLHGERGAIIVGWFTKIVIVLAVIGVIGFEATSIGVTHVQAQDTAKEAARAGSREWRESRDVQRAYEAADAVAAADSGRIEPEEFVIHDDGSVTVTVETEASSLLLHRLSFTRGLIEVRETAEGRFIP